MGIYAFRHIQEPNHPYDPVKALTLILLLATLTPAATAETACVDLINHIPCAAGVTTDCAYGKGAGLILLNNEVVCVRTWP